MFKSKLFYLQYFLVSSLYICSFFIIYNGLRENKIFRNTLGIFTDSYTIWEGKPVKGEHSFIRIGTSNIYNWDANHYKTISDYLYDQSISNECEYAFFPMLPLLWKALGIENTQVIYLNILLFALGLLVYFHLIKDISWQYMLLCWSLPSTVVFFIPYTEALFFVVFCILLLGIFRQNVFLIILGGLLSASTRPSVSIIIISFLCTSILRFIKIRKIDPIIKMGSIASLSLLAGLFLTGSYQHHLGSEHWYSFLTTQNCWDHLTFSIPKHISVWSCEGFSLNVGVIVFVSTFAVIETIRHLFSHSSWDNMHFLYIVSLAYIIGTTIFIIFFQQGSLHGLFRYILCTPMFFVFVHKVSSSNVKKAYSKIMALIGFSILGFILIKASEVCYKFDFFNLGFLLCGVSMIFFFLLHILNSKVFNIILILYVIISIVWTAYLLNLYLCNSWIYT